MVGAEAAPENDLIRISIYHSSERKDFFKDILLILDVTENAIAGPAPVIVVRLLVYGVDAKDLQPALFEMMAKGSNQPVVLVVEKAPATGRKSEDAGAGVTEHDQFHVAPETAGVPPVIFAFHFS